MKKPVPFRIKVCGVRHAGDLEMLASVGVDAIGLNFVPTSPRCVSLEEGRSLSIFAKQLGLISIAVTMNETPDRLDQIVDQVVVDYVQLHGNEPPEIAFQLQSKKIIKSVSWSGRTDEQELAEAWFGSNLLCAFLVDAYSPEVGGGSGKVARWDLLNPRPKCFAKHPLILAGGLTPENVESGIEMTECEAVDVASGVEFSAGSKSADLTKRFVEAAKFAFQRSTN